MSDRLATVFVAILLGFCTPSLSAQSLLLEWADRPGDPKWMAGNPVFQRTLSCWSEDRREVCQLIVVTIGHDFRPAVLIADAFRTDTDNLKISRTRNAMDIEFTDSSNTWTIHLKLTEGTAPIVEQASGVVVTRAILPSDQVRSSELVALVAGRSKFPTREFAEVNLKCAKISVVAAKRAAK